MSQPEKIISLEKITVPGQGRNILEDISLTIRSGDIWNIVGKSGSGKSALLNILMGTTPVRSGKIVYHFIRKSQNKNLSAFPRKPISLVKSHPILKSRSGSRELYYQQRYNAQDAEDILTVKDYLQSILLQKITSPLWTYADAITLLDLEGLQERTLIKLSNGETKRLMIATALLESPLLLLMDNPTAGLDVKTRDRFDYILSSIAERGTAIVITSGLKEISPAATHLVLMEQGNARFAGAKNTFPFDTVQQEKDEIEPDLPYLSTRQERDSFRWIVKMTQVNVKYGKEDILKNINWNIKQGERWALSGPNGSGKTTLLSLINGDNPQAYANDILLFDKKRGTGESIWDIKKNIGFVSPELHQFFPGDQTCLKVVESGFYDTPGLFRKSNPDKKEKSNNWLQYMKLGHKAEALFHTLSYSDQRLCLLARALVKAPVLLILDEPCQGLDIEQQTFFRRTIEKLCEVSDTTLIYVTHFPDELPSCIQNELRLA